MIKLIVIGSCLLTVLGIDAQFVKSVKNRIAFKHAEEECKSQGEIQKLEIPGCETLEVWNKICIGVCSPDYEPHTVKKTCKLCKPSVVNLSLVISCGNQRVKRTIKRIIGCGCVKTSCNYSLD